MADNKDKNKSILQLLRGRAGMQMTHGALAGYEVSGRTVITCPGCGTADGHGVGFESCSHCGHAFRAIELGEGWYPKVAAGE